MTTAEIAVITERLDELIREVAVVRGLAEATNGRVTALEAARIARAAREDERRKIAAAAAEAAQESETRRREGRQTSEQRKARQLDRTAAAVTGAFLVVLGAVVSNAWPF